MSYRRHIQYFARLAPVLALAAASVPAWAGPGLVRTVRCSATESSARIVVDLSRSMPYNVGLSSDSTALVVTVDGAVSESSLGEVRVGGGGVRTAQTHTQGTPGSHPRVEVTLALDSRVTWTHFALPADRRKPARIVVDVQRGTGPPPSASTVAAASLAADADSDEAAPLRSAPGAVMEARDFVIALDAGHGGHDTGTTGMYGLVEKKVALDLAQRVADDLNRRKGIRTVLTRDGDFYLTLPERNAKAEKLGADVFVSIHLNSAPSRSARGAEIYFVAPAGAERAATRVLASGEAADEFGLDDRHDADIVHMLLDVNQQSVLVRSEALAAAILESVRSRDILPTRNVKQKSFSVLRTISMPSVLVEAGFLSNSSDAKMLRGDEGRTRVAHAIADGIAEFLRANPPQRGEGSQRVVHKVQNGDTLWTISRRYNTTVNRLCQLNGLRARQPLHVGQEIVVRR